MARLCSAAVYQMVDATGVAAGWPLSSRGARVNKEVPTKTSGYCGCGGTELTTAFRGERDAHGEAAARRGLGAGLASPVLVSPVRSTVGFTRPSRTIQCPQCALRILEATCIPAAAGMRGQIVSSTARVCLRPVALSRLPQPPQPQAATGHGSVAVSGKVLRKEP